MMKRIGGLPELGNSAGTNDRVGGSVGNEQACHILR